jgi:hypothetical protein
MDKLRRIEKLEKKYFLNILKVLKENIHLVEDRLTFLNRNKQYWEENQKLDNAIAIGVQELIRAIIYRHFTNWKPFFLPVCSDTAFETEDVIVNLDIKTVKEIDNDAKQGYLQIRPNQMSYPNKPFNGVPWHPHQPTIIKNNDEKELYTLSFFVKFIWTRKQNDEIDITEIVLSSIPNGILSKEYGDDFIINYKTYDVDTLEEADELSEVGFVEEEWSTIGINFVRLNDGTIWGKPKKRTKKYGDSWHQYINGGTARFNIKKIAEPKLTKGWKRLEHIKDTNQEKLK